jgi:HEAT repeat protein
MTPQEQPDIETLTAEIAAALRSWSWNRHFAAKERLKSVGPQGIEVLFRILQRETASYRIRKYRVFWPSFAIALISCAVFWRSVPLSWLPLYLPGVNLLFGLSTMLGAMPSRIYRSAIQLLTEFDDVRAIPYLLDTHEDTTNNELLEKTLTRLLPLLKEDDGGFFDTASRNALRGKLRRGIQQGFFSNCTRQEEALLIAILKGLEQIGTQDDLPVVEQLANKGVTEELKTAAQECLPYLQQYGGERTLRQTLLRPSSTNGETESTLLRPVQTTPDNSPTEQLLRPHE